MEKQKPLRDILLEEPGRKDISADTLTELAGLGRATVYKILAGKNAAESGRLSAHCIFALSDRIAVTVFSGFTMD